MTAPAAAPELNRAYYDAAPDGVEDYWRYMPAPRHRVATLLRALRADRPRSVADLGCGDGRFLAAVARALPGARLAGVDLSSRRIAANRARHGAWGWWVVDLDGEPDLPPALTGSFDAVVATEVIEHLDRPRSFLATARRIAAPGGRLYLSTQSGPLRETERRVGHRRHFSAAEMRELLSEAGWEPRRVWNTGYPFHDLSKWWANRDPDASMRRFGGDAYGLPQRLVCALLGLLFRLNSTRRGAQLFALAAAPG